MASFSSRYRKQTSMVLDSYNFRSRCKLFCPVRFLCCFLIFQCCELFSCFLIPFLSI
jgi:hypothetical protein